MTDGAIALLLDEREAERFEAERPEAAALVALTPAAWGALAPESRALLLPDPLTDRAHARIAARARRATRRFEAALAEAEARAPAGRRPHLGTRHYIVSTVQHQAFTVARVWEILRGTGSGPWLIPEPAGWRRCEDRAEAHAAFMAHLRARRPIERNDPQSNALFRLLRRLVLRLIRDRGPWLLTTRQRLVYGLDTLIRRGARSPRIFTLDPRGNAWRDYLLLWRLLRDGLGGAPAVKLPLAATPKPGAEGAVAEAIAAIGDPVILRGLGEEPLHGFLLEETAYCEGLYDETLAVVRTLRPLRYVSRQDSGRQAPIADAAGGAGVPRTVINYNSFPSRAPGVASHVQRFMFNVRMPETLSDLFVMWSPHLARLSREIYGPRGLARTQPLRLAPVPRDTAAERAPGPYRVLHASNFTEWAQFFPWIMETSLEFVADILALERVCDGLDEVELTIRTKPKGEANPADLRRLLPEDTRAAVTGTERPFPEALTDCDLMVGFGSTTIEEAMLYRKPVLLWGPTRRFMQLEARDTPPGGPDDRAPVYVAHSREALGPMLLAVLKAHAGRPLTDAEIAAHVWPAGTPGLEELARTLAEPPRAPAAEAPPLPSESRAA